MTLKSTHRSVESWRIRQSWSATRLHSWCSFPPLQMNSFQLNQINSDDVQFTSSRGRARERRWRHSRRCVECSHSTCIEYSKPLSHSRPEVVIRPAREQYLQIVQPLHPGIAAYPEVAAWWSCHDCRLQCDWFSPRLLECRNGILSSSNEYRTRWRASFCVVEIVHTSRGSRQLWRSFTGYRFNIVSRSKQ